MRPCAAGGYAIYANGSLVSFDGPSSKKVEQFLREKDSRLNVAVIVKKEGNKHSLVEIKND